MSTTFSHTGSGKLLFGIGEFSRLASHVTLEESLLVCGHSFLKTDQYKTIKQLVKYQRIIKGEPDPETIDSITSDIKGKIQSVVAIGGGSVLDAGKAIAAMCCSEGSIEDYLEGIGTEKTNGNTLPVTAIPTTAGTGSEATKNAVICRRGNNGYKKSLRHDNYIPSLIIIDPLLYIQCPSKIMSSCGMDAFCQLLESFISVQANLYTDILAWKGLTLFIDNFMELCLSETKDPDQMGKIAFAAYLSGMTLANAGLGTVHGIAGPMGGFYNIPHGTACGTLLPEIMRRTISRLYDSDNKTVINKIETLDRYIRKGEDSGFTIINLLEEWQEKLSIPHLSEYGIDKQGAEKIAIASGNKNSPVEFSKEEIKEMIVSRI
jgi:alcohol dehydrogenase class IV